MAVLALEFLALFVLTPSALALGWIPARPVPLLMLVTVGLWAILRRTDSGFDWRMVLHLPRWTQPMRTIVLRFAALAALLGAGVAIWRPFLLFDLLRTQPIFWVALMVLYPLLSVLPQEFLFRAFFFHRYRPLFGEGAGIVLASAVAFGFVHIIFGNWLAVVLSFFGGLLFATTYRLNRSMPLVWLEHALFGNLIFTIGLGRYFSSGALG